MQIAVGVTIAVTSYLGVWYMKSLRSFPQLVITKKGSASVKAGHPWIYEDEVIRGEEGAENGCLVDAVTENGNYLGTGFYSRLSRIRVRLVSQNANDCFDSSFWKRRIEYAWQYRKVVMREDLDCCRVIFGEADGFPGLTVDRFHDLLVAQCVSYGMEEIKRWLYPMIIEVLRQDGQIIRGLFERNDLTLRTKEGLPRNKGWFPLNEGTEAGSPFTVITENDIRYLVDVENGQKTGFFLDQKYNRRAVSTISKGLHVLDCFTHTGSFALNAWKGGAASVTAVDVSDYAIQLARKNAEMNTMEGIHFVVADIFEYLAQLSQSGTHQYDLIILDPPAFTKSRKTLKHAEKGYEEINARAMKILPRGGYLCTASCSHFMTADRFEAMLTSAAREAGRSLRQIEKRQQAPDHPILWNVPETDYLKFYLFQVT